MIRPTYSIEMESYHAGYILANDTLHISKGGRIKFGTATIERLFKEASKFVEDGKNYKLIVQPVRGE
jgi:hypothetical protein